MRPELSHQPPDAPAAHRNPLSQQRHLEPAAAVDGMVGENPVERFRSSSSSADNRASVAVTRTAALDLVGLGLHGDRKTVDKITGGLKFLA